MVVTVYSNDDTINWGATGDERIVQNVRNILRTRPYEVPFMRGMGVDSDFTDAIPQKLMSEIESHVMDVINTYEPRAEVVDVRIESRNENGEYVIAVDLEV